MTGDGLSRRRALTGAATVGLGLPLLTACAGGGTTAGDGPEPGDSGGGMGTTLAPASEVPVGSGLILPDQEVVVTQPSTGEFRGFSSICTHQSCPVTAVSDTIECSCHGSSFSITDGSVLGGPASDPLPEVPVRVEGDQVVLG